MRGCGCIMVLMSKLVVPLVKDARPCRVEAAPASGGVTGTGVATTGPCSIVAAPANGGVTGTGVTVGPCRVVAAPSNGEVTGAGVVTTGLVVCSWEPNVSLTIWNNNANKVTTHTHTHTTFNYHKFIQY